MEPISYDEEEARQRIPYVQLLFTSFQKSQLSCAFGSKA